MSTCAAVPSRVANASASTSPVPERQDPSTCTPTRCDFGVACRASRRPGRARGASCPGRSRSRRCPPPTPGSRTAGRGAPGTPGRRRACAPPGGPTAALARSRRADGAGRRSQTSAFSRRLRITSSRCSRRLSPALPLISSARLTTLSRPSYGVDPLRGGLGSDAGHAGQVVRGLADQGRQLGVAVGRNAVLRLDGLPGSSASSPRPRASGRSPWCGRSPAGRSHGHHVQISTSKPSSIAWVARVPMMSSAS